MAGEMHAEWFFLSWDAVMDLTIKGIPNGFGAALQAAAEPAGVQHAREICLSPHPRSGGAAAKGMKRGAAFNAAAH
jgi:hypothetical protein